MLENEVEVREKIAQQLAKFDNWDWEQIHEESIHLFHSSPSKSAYRRRADEILALIELPEPE